MERRRAAGGDRGHVTSRSGDRCVVRMVHSLFTEKDDWDDELESFEPAGPDSSRCSRCTSSTSPANRRRRHAMASHPGANRTHGRS